MSELDAVYDIVWQSFCNERAHVKLFVLFFFGECSMICAA